MSRQENLVDFDEMFDFAEKHHQIEWNDCCDMFHRNYILCDDEGHDQSFELDYVNEVLENPEKNIWKYTPKKKLAYEIIKEFMEHHNISSMYVINDF